MPTGRSRLAWIISVCVIFVISTYLWTTEILTGHLASFLAKQPIDGNVTDEDAVPPVVYARRGNSSRAYPLLVHSLYGKNMLYNRLTDDYTYCKRVLPFMGPFNFTTQSKNPCWRGDDGTFRCIPYFYVPGFSKSGTTDLFTRIQKHPQILSHHKEFHWLDYLRYYDNYRFIQNYTDMFAQQAVYIDEWIGLKGHSDFIFGDGTPCQVWYSLYWRCFEGNQGLSQPRYTNADLLYRLYPQTKVILLLREPVDRLYSRFLTWIYRAPHSAYKNPSPLSFHDIVVDAIAKYTQCFKQWSPRHCVYDGKLYTETALRLQEGIYSVFLKDWLKVFPRNQLLILRFEDYVKDIGHHMQKVFSFLEIAPADADTMKTITKIKPKNPGKHYAVGKMLNKTRAILEDFYRPFVQELPGLLSDKSFLWHYDKA